MEDALEKCVIAAELLAVSDASLRDRLEDAHASALSRLTPEEIPEHARESLAKLADRLDRGPRSPDGSVRGRLREASEKEVMQLATLAWDVIEAVLYQSAK